MANKFMTIDELVEEIHKAVDTIFDEHGVIDSIDRDNVMISLAAWIGVQPMQMGDTKR